MRFPLSVRQDEGERSVNSSAASSVNSRDSQGEHAIYLPHFCQEVKIVLCFHRPISINLENVPRCLAKGIVEE